MTERERLIEIICEGLAQNCGGNCTLPNKMYCQNCHILADYLLANGVIVPPCKVGDTVYFVHRGRIKQLEIHNITYSSKYKDFYLYFVSDDGSESNINYNHFIGYKLFLTKEEAEKAL